MADDYKQIVDNAVNAFEQYAHAINEAFALPDDQRNWGTIARICDANAAAWTKLATLYRAGEEQQRGTTASESDGDDYPQKRIG